MLNWKLTQVANYKNILISEKFLPKNYLSLIELTDFFAVETLIFSVEILRLRPSIDFRVETSNLSLLYESLENQSSTKTTP